MSRIRTIKPEFFRHETLFETERATGLPLRVAFAGLWTVADREGRFRWRPRQLKLDVLPFDEVDFARVLDVLSAGGFIVRYASGAEEYGAIPSWHRHQVINNRESASTLPAPPKLQTPTDDDATGTRAPRVIDATATWLVQEQGEGEGEGNGREEERDASVASQSRRRPKAADPQQGDLSPSVPCPYDDIVARYHDKLPLLPRVRLMPAGRQKAMRKVWGWVLSSNKSGGERRATCASEALEWFSDYFARASANAFLMGRAGRSAEHASWQCDLDFLLTDKGMKQVIEKTEAAA